MVAQWLHAYLGTLGNHDVAVVPAGFLCLYKLELVETSLCTIPATQFSFKCTFGFCAHDGSVAARCLPTVTTTTRSAESLVIAAMVRCKRAESAWELSLNGIPTAREIPICVAMGRVRNVVVLANES
jgi:hypothetical protein